jgi:prefoldin alpha subunit
MVDVNKRLEEKYSHLQDVNKEIKEFEEAISRVDKEMVDVSKAKEVLDVVENNNDYLLIPISTGVFVKAKVENKGNFLVNVGSSVVVEKDRTGVLKLLDKQITEMSRFRHKMIDGIEQSTAKARVIEEQIVELEGK